MYFMSFADRLFRDNATDIPGRPSGKYPHLLSLAFVLYGNPVLLFYQPGCLLIFNMPLPFRLVNSRKSKFIA